MRSIVSAITYLRHIVRSSLSDRRPSTLAPTRGREHQRQHRQERQQAPASLGIGDRARPKGIVTPPSGAVEFLGLSPMTDGDEKRLLDEVLALVEGGTR